MDLIKFLVESYCLFHGFKVKILESKQDLKAAFDLKNRVNQYLTGLAPVPEEEALIYPKGIARVLGLYKKGQLIGTIQLMDLTQIIPYASKMYANAILDYNPKTTYEVKSFVVDTQYQHGVGGVFNLLLYYSILFTQQTNRDKWLVVTSNSFYEKLKKRSGLPSMFISDDYCYLKDDSPQSRYSANYAEKEYLKDYTCYYIKIPQGVLEKLAFKFFRMSITKSLKKLNPFRGFQAIKLNTH